ncbi:peroxidasin homolog isoform X2 [Montipora capricornis]|uniref:peroxidasin homolog isoform X2 n=1 Tax=Montipora capricornis TaxID=246305 RepID=UPI0035F13A97
MTGDSGDQIPERCVPIDRCGTRAPGWLNGTHPSVQDGLQTAQVCYHWNNDCCQWKSNIKIRNCSSYFVYQLVKHPACNLRYCVCAVITPISDKVITEGANLTLSCQATGVFPPTVFWVKTSSGQRTNGTELVLKNISRNEAGDYRCEARNLCGNASESAKIDVQFPAFIVPFVDRIIVQKGDDVPLFCNASGTPPPSVMWTHVHTGRKLYSETWLITAIQVGDLGEYRCDANNTYGHATDSVTIELEVPAFIVPFVDRIIVQKGDDVPLFCNASGTPPLFVMWTHVPTGRKQYSKTWLITAIQVDDLGEYRCDANNNYGHATDSVTIEFKVPAFIVPFVDRIIVQKGDDVPLFCNASGTPPLFVMWTHVPTGRKQYSKTWLITAIQVDDLGEYRCDANNNYGHATDSVTIEFKASIYRTREKRRTRFIF